MIFPVPAQASPPDPYAEQDAARSGKPAGGWRLWLYEFVFESHTRWVFTQECPDE
jgi:hypothetical protein